ncbi:MAG: phosphatase PAP2 family protein [Sandaracinaceae bacterium]|jgi:hypothetical protein|nr:phosphatase PAP2 family protein [Sandaracinaceae bacterium]MBP7682959.1 phosphatase PAP2 family protein [Deltaproteobacteria bacterium]MBK6810347.1 phosphatase PAP2 family protein [Sandaracinaceae bacterium]MBK7153719.1 phosphatase PAP2 family protein [Sandaracinaceae bacterium]MBK7775219.1 phosphatase PAP2 family protein [Sandaracinaceae bacterium]
MHQPDAYSPRGVREAASTALQNLALQDLAALAFHVYMLLRVSVAPHSNDRDMAIRYGVALLSATAAALLIARGEVLKPGPARSLLYRVGIFVPVVLSYFQMRFLLPALQPALVDRHLYALDQALFGTTPAIWFQQFNQLHIVEWVSFFYYSYFALMILCLIPPLFLDSGRRQIEMMIGGLAVATVGHFVYTLVPGKGPVATLDFEPLNGGFWWHQVEVTVASAGAQLDIFPSLHTAYPMFFALHAYGWRHTNPYRYVWFILAFFSANIVIATMFLRWHWFVDVVAGVMLAVLARQCGKLVAEREADRGCDGDERQPVWEPILRGRGRRSESDAE